MDYQRVKRCNILISKISEIYKIMKILIEKLFGKYKSYKYIQTKESCEGIGLF